MIFVCVGSRPYQFDRLFIELDRLVEIGAIRESIFAQIGASTYKPKHFEYEHFLDSNSFAKKINSANIVISHGASGSIMTALNAGKKVITVARLAKYGEHINDHQVAINETLASENLVLNVTNMANLGQAIQLLQSDSVKLKTWSNENPNAILDAIDEYIQENVL